MTERVYKRDEKHSFVCGDPVWNETLKTDQVFCDAWVEPRPHHDGLSSHEPGSCFAPTNRRCQLVATDLIHRI